MKLIDTHCHLNDRRFDKDRPAVLQAAGAAGVEKIINVGYDIASSEQGVALAHSHPGIFAVVGVHPHDAAKASPDYLQVLKRLAGKKKILAIGEIGLDYYRDLSPRPTQRKVFVEQLKVAREVELPVVIHCREAIPDVYDILSREAIGLPGVMHCFSGNWEEAGRFLALGFYISIAGPVTFTKNDSLVEVVKLAPLERLLLETDAPYLAPVPYRGKRNEPAYLVHTARRVAEVRGLSLEEVAQATTENAAQLFGSVLNTPETIL
ncbi:MAG: TatD family hydrolase [Bacillota bacterium]